jgi:hypothetical protein
MYVSSVSTHLPYHTEYQNIFTGTDYIAQPAIGSLFPCGSRECLQICIFISNTQLHWPSTPWTGRYAKIKLFNNYSNLKCVRILCHFLYFYNPTVTLVQADLPFQHVVNTKFKYTTNEMVRVPVHNRILWITLSCHSDTRTICVGVQAIDASKWVFCTFCLMDTRGCFPRSKAVRVWS